MKKNLVFLLIAFLTLNFTACKDDDKNNDPITIEGQDFKIDGTFNVTNKDNTASVIVNIAAENGIENLIVKIESPALDEAALDAIGLNGEFDLANPATPQLAAALKALGLISEDQPIKNAKTTKFDVSKFMPMLAAFQMDGPHKFYLTVKDTAGNTLKKTLTVYFPNLKK